MTAAGLISVNTMRMRRWTARLCFATGIIFLTCVPAAAQYLAVSFDLAGQQKILDKATLLSQEASLLGFGVSRIFAIGEEPGAFMPELNLSFLRRKADLIGYGINNVDEASIFGGARIFLPATQRILFTLSGLGGFSWLWGGGYSTMPQFAARLSGGLGYNIAGSLLLFEFVYRPVEMEMELMDIWGGLVGTLTIEPSWNLRISVLF